MDLVEYGEKFIGVPYVWGGSNAVQGFDCSGFVQEVLSSRGIDPAGDQTAHALHSKLIDEGYVEHSSPKNIERNDILFFGKTRLTHVAIAVDSVRMLEAGGGGSTTTSIREASKRPSAMVRVRPIRKDLLYVLRPVTQLEMDV